MRERSMMLSYLKSFHPGRYILLSPCMHTPHTTPYSMLASQSNPPPSHTNLCKMPLLLRTKSVQKIEIAFVPASLPECLKPLLSRHALRGTLQCFLPDNAQSKRTALSSLLTTLLHVYTISSIVVVTVSRDYGAHPGFRMNGGASVFAALG